ncbi:hypothetical protein K439DRAFT_1283014, partial [Ramaria rubella]
DANNLYFAGIAGSGPNKKVAPETLKEALAGKDTSHWKKALKDELQSLSENNVSEIAPISKGEKPITSKIVFHI